MALSPRGASARPSSKERGHPVAPGLAGSCRDHGDDVDDVTGRHLAIGAVDAGFMEAGLGDARLGVVADDLTGHATEEGKGATVGTDPVRQVWLQVASA